MYTHSRLLKIQSHLQKYFFRKAHTKATQEWLDRLAQENVYVLVCLTYADKLYAELMSKDGKHLNKAVAKCELQKQKEVSYYMPIRMIVDYMSK